MFKKNVITAGKKVAEADKALIMLHGRGASAEDILTLVPQLNVADFALVAPQAIGNSWYPNSFLSPPENNEPYLSNALLTIHEIIEEIAGNGISKAQIYFLGFSQGACLVLEYVTRNAVKYGGVVAFTGGLIGDKIYPQNYRGDFEGTNVFIGTSDPDPHVPVTRVYASINILNEMNAATNVKVYPDMGHTINADEIGIANQIIFR